MVDKQQIDKTVSIIVCDERTCSTDIQDIVDFCSENVAATTCNWLNQSFSKNLKLAFSDFPIQSNEHSSNVVHAAPMKQAEPKNRPVEAKRKNMCDQESPSAKRASTLVEGAAAAVSHNCFYYTSKPECAIPDDNFAAPSTSGSSSCPPQAHAVNASSSISNVAPDKKVLKICPLFERKSTQQTSPWHHDERQGFLRWFSEGFEPKPKVAAFDMDGTLISTNSGRKFPKDSNDWRLLHETELKRKLKNLVDTGFCIVIISNQVNVCLFTWPFHVFRFRSLMMRVHVHSWYAFTNRGACSGIRMYQPGDFIHVNSSAGFPCRFSPMRSQNADWYYMYTCAILT